MHDKSYPARALAASSRTMARQHRTDRPLDDLLTWTFEGTIAERASVAVCRRSCTLAVYRGKPGGGLLRLQRWPQARDRRLLCPRATPGQDFYFACGWGCALT